MKAIKLFLETLRRMSCGAPEQTAVPLTAVKCCEKCSRDRSGVRQKGKAYGFFEGEEEAAVGAIVARMAALPTIMAALVGFVATKDEPDVVGSARAA